MESTKSKLHNLALGPAARKEAQMRERQAKKVAAGALSPPPRTFKDKNAKPPSPKLTVGDQLAEYERREQQKTVQMEKEKKEDARVEVAMARMKIEAIERQNAPPEMPRWSRVRITRRAREPGIKPRFKRPIAGHPTAVLLEHVKKVDEDWDRNMKGEKALTSPPLGTALIGEKEEGWGADASVGTSTRQRRLLLSDPRSLSREADSEPDPLRDVDFNIRKGFFSRLNAQTGPIIQNDLYRRTILPRDGHRGKNVSPAVIKKAQVGELQSSTQFRTSLRSTKLSGNENFDEDADEDGIQNSDASEEQAMRRLRESLGKGELVLARINLHQLPLAVRLSFVQSMGMIKSLSLANNMLTRLPRDFFLRWRSLQRLAAAGNRLSYVDEEIGSLRSLTHLDLANNQLIRLPVSLGTLPLKELVLEGNVLEEVPPITATSLVSLRLRANSLGCLPGGLNKCKNLTSIDASYNSIVTLFIVPPIEIDPDPDLFLNPAEWEGFEEPGTGKPLWRHRRNGKLLRANPAERLQKAKDIHEETMRQMDARLRGEGGEDSDDEEWVEQWDPQYNAPYYLNKMTGESSWENPTAIKEAQKAAAAREEQRRKRMLADEQDDFSSTAWKPPPPEGPPSEEEDEEDETGEEKAGDDTRPLSERLKLDLSSLRPGQSKGSGKPVTTASGEGKTGKQSGTKSVDTRLSTSHTSAKGQVVKKKARVAPSILKRRRMRALKGLGKGEWELLVDMQVGTVRFRNNTTLVETDTPPPVIDTIGELQFLRVLNLSHNKLSILPASIGELFRLEELRLDNNILTPDSFPPAFARLSLWTLDLAQNRVRFIPPGITHMTTLRHLILDDNKVSA